MGLFDDLAKYQPEQTEGNRYTIKVNDEQWTIDKDYDRLTAGQFEMISKAIQQGEQAIDSLHFVLAILCLPAKGIHKNEKEIDRIGRLLWANLSWKQAYDIAFFLSNGTKAFSPLSMLFTNKMTWKKMIKAKMI